MRGEKLGRGLVFTETLNLEVGLSQNVLGLAQTWEDFTRKYSRILSKIFPSFRGFGSLISFCQMLIDYHNSHL